MLRDDERKWLAEAEAATPGPWTPSIESDRGYNKNNDYGRFFMPTFNEAPFALMCMGGEECERQANIDAAFIASSRTAVPTLCQRLEAMAAALRERVEKCWCKHPTIRGAIPGDDPCDLCRKAMTLLEGRGT